MSLLLVADIGGTNGRFGLVEFDAEKNRINGHNDQGLLQ
jgi:glucokinase